MPNNTQCGYSTTTNRSEWWKKLGCRTIQITVFTSELFPSGWDSWLGCKILPKMWSKGAYTWLIFCWAKMKKLIFWSKLKEICKAVSLKNRGDLCLFDYLFDSMNIFLFGNFISAPNSILFLHSEVLKDIKDILWKRTPKLCLRSRSTLEKDSQVPHRSTSTLPLKSSPQRYILVHLVWISQKRNY